VTRATGRAWGGRNPVALGLLTVLLAVAGALRLASGQSTPPFAGVLTYHNDNLRTGQNLAETILTTANVNSGQFGLLFTLPVDGEVYAQPLYVPSVAVSDLGTHNIVIVATENDSVYAFDADSGGSPLWFNNLVPAGGSAIPSSDTGCGDLTPQIGITGTPVIDPANNTMFAVTATKESGNYIHRLHAIDIRSGAEQSGSPVVVQGSLAATGPNSTSGQIAVTAFYNNQRPALLLDNGVIYIAFSSHCDSGLYSGWVLGYNETSLSQVALFADESGSNGSDGGIWMSGGGLATDSSGDVYLSTGNGDYDGVMDLGDSFLRLTPSGSSFTVKTSFTPYDQLDLSDGDLDLGSGALLLLPDEPSPPTHLALSAGKTGTLCLVNRDSMGGYNGPNGPDNVIQEVSIGGGLFSAPAYFNNNIYLVPQGGMPEQFSLSGGLLSTNPVAMFAQNFAYNGATPSISANGTSNGIVWMIQNFSCPKPCTNNGDAVLFALDASNIGNELYDSTQSSADAGGPFNKFQVPTIANGKVYVGTQTEVDVYGELASTRTNTVAITQRASGTAHPGVERAGGTFVLTNSTGGSETVSGATISFSNPALFKSATLGATAGALSRSANAKPPEASTAFSFKTALKLEAGKNATFTLHYTAAKGATAASNQQVTAVTTSVSSPANGVPGDLGTVSPPSK